ncbi:MAG: protein kinase, partial [Pyrinomonadaceae bacterium]
VALKRTFFTEDNALAAAFEREARILARLRHPVLPKVIDHFVENGDQYLVMEHISGDDLSKRLESAGKPFPLSWVMFWADQLLDALSYLHSHEPAIIHRDIKPQNLKLTDDNHIVLLDFGLSKDFDTKSTSNPLNSASVAGYSPHFASMEQVRGTGTDARSDIYSLSATLYQLMANSVPVDALSRADALLGGKADPIIPLNELNDEITPAISEVIIKGAALRQDERYTTAAEMQKALRRAFDRGKKESTAAVAAAAPTTPHTVVTGKAVDSKPSESKTRAFSDPLGSSYDQTVEMKGLAAPADIKQSGVKTEMFAPPELEQNPEIETRISDPGSHKIAAADQAQPSPPQTSRVAASAGAAAPNGKGDVAAVSVATVPKKGSSSKFGLVAGALFCVVILGAIVAAGGWYMYSNNMLGGATTAPTPSPEPTESVPVAVNPDPISSTEPANTEAANVDENSNAEPAGTPAPAQPPTRTAPTPGTRLPTVRPPSTPAGKPTPKPKPKDDRTVIIQ